MMVRIHIAHDRYRGAWTEIQDSHLTPQGADIENPELRGLIPRITEQIFASIGSADSAIEYTVKVSYMEIYMERIKDLLNRKWKFRGSLCETLTEHDCALAAEDNLTIHEDKARGVYVKGLTEVYVGSETEVYAVMKAGGASRAVSATRKSAHTGDYLAKPNGRLKSFADSQR
jgi:kinesin family protein 5